MQTNGNHERASEAYARRFGVPILSAARGNLLAGATVAGDLAVHALAGAGPGEHALLHPAGSLHVGDALIHMDSYGFALLPDKYCENPKELRRSLARLAERRYATMAFAHGDPLVGKADDRLRSLLSLRNPGGAG